LGPVPQALDDAKKKGVLYQISPDRFLLGLGKIARYLVSEGREIVIERVPGGSDDAVRVFLFGSVFGALLHQRGVLPLHGSAVMPSRGATIFAGPSGSGKSMLAAAASIPSSVSGFGPGAATPQAGWTRRNFPSTS
jgi:hypothetical protein